MTPSSTSARNQYRRVSPLGLPASCHRAWARSSTALRITWSMIMPPDRGYLRSILAFVSTATMHDATNAAWAAFVLGTQRTGFITAAAAQEAALSLARAQLEEGLRRIGELKPQAAAGDVHA